MKKTREVWAEINLDALKDNVGAIKKCISGGARLCGVVKADAYGHGAIEVARILLEEGASYLAVATLSEAIQLRKCYKNVDILILGYTRDESIDDLLAYDITQTLYSLEQAEYFSACAVAAGKRLKVHIKLDTGMHRIGFPINNETVEKMASICRLKGLYVEGMFSHFAVADDEDKTYTHEQAKAFLSVDEALKAKGIHLEIKHIANSAAIIDCPEYHFDMVRAGIILYGLYPSDKVKKERLPLKEVMTLRAEISHVKRLEKGQSISYGLTYTAQENETICTVPIGYADGFTRLYSQKAKGLSGAIHLQQVGRICMDQCMFKAESPNIHVGDVITLMGGNLPEISIDDYADAIGSINYEVVCMIGKRVPRLYIYGGNVSHYDDYLRD